MSIFNFRSTAVENVIDKLQTGDVLLYRGRGVASFFISGLTDSRYTHVGILFFENGEPMVKIVDKPSRLDRAFVAHFREWKGGIIVSLKREVKRYRGRIDVYRPSKEFPVVAINFDGTVNESTIPYDGNRVANKIKALTGIDYGWSRIAVLWARKWFGLRLFTKKTGEVTDIHAPLISPVCSSSIAWCFNTCGYVLVNNKNPNLVTPADLAESPHLHYLYTLE